MLEWDSEDVTPACCNTLHGFILLDEIKRSAFKEGFFFCVRVRVRVTWGDLYLVILRPFDLGHCFLLGLSLVFLYIWLSHIVLISQKCCQSDEATCST